MERASRLKQVKIYTLKCFRSDFVHERGWKLFISSAIIALIICMVINNDKMFISYTDTRNGAFAVVCACVWIGIFNSIQSICKQRDVIKRDHRSGMHLSSFVVSHMLYDLFLCVVESMIVTGIMCFFCRDNLPSMGVFLPTVIELWIAFFLTIYASDALGMMVSSIVKTPNTAMTVMPFVLIIQLVLSGFIFELKEGGFADVISNVTVAKWSLNSICISANVNGMRPELDFVLKMQMDNHDKYEFTVGNFMMNNGILIGFILLYMIVSIAVLQLVDRDKR